MIALSKKLDYALIGLAHLVENRGLTVSARQIARTHGLPLPLLMKILKALHQQGILMSTRGVRGGYQICLNLDDLSLARLIAIVDGIEAPAALVQRRLSTQPPVQALQYKLVRFLEDVRVSDLVKPGRRIDVPWEQIRIAAAPRKVPAEPVAVSA